MRAFCYCRVSTEEQSTDDHYSLGNQEKKAKDYAKLKDWRIVKVKKDVASGKDTNRPGFRDLVCAIKAKEVDAVVVYRLDRLSRNVRDIYDMLDLMREHDVAFVSISEGFDTTTAMGRAMLGVAAVFAQLTREMIAENVKDGLMRRAESGKWNGPKWNPPYGYKYVVGGTIEPIPEEAEIVRQIFQWFTRDKWGTTKIARFLNSQGIIRNSAMPGSGQWHQSKIWEMLQNPVYAGYITAGDKLAQGAHESLIDEDTWEITKEIVASRKKQPPRAKATPHLLSWFVRCGSCGRALVGQKAKYKNKQGEQHFVGFRHSPNEFSGDRYCPGTYHRGDTLEEAVVNAIMELANKPDLKEMAVDSVRRKLEKEGNPLRDEATNLQAILMDIDTRFEQWASRLDRRIIDEQQFVKHNAVLLAEKEKATMRLEEIERQLAQGETIEVSLSEIESVLCDIPRVWESLSFEERREILRLLVDKVTVHPDKVELYLYHLPVQELQTRRSGRLYQRKSG